MCDALILFVPGCGASATITAMTSWCWQPAVTAASSFPIWYPSPQSHSDTWWMMRSSARGRITTRRTSKRESINSKTLGVIFSLLFFITVSLHSLSFTRYAKLPLLMFSTNNVSPACQWSYVACPFSDAQILKSVLCDVTNQSISIKSAGLTLPVKKIAINVYLYCQHIFFLWPVSQSVLMMCFYIPQWSNFVSSFRNCVGPTTRPASAS